MLDEIKEDLAENYRNDEKILEKIMRRVQKRALSISNREDIEGLESYIIETTKALYLARGGEGISSESKGSQSISYKDPMEEMRKKIIRDGKRIMK